MRRKTVGSGKESLGSGSKGEIEGLAEGWSEATAA